MQRQGWAGLGAKRDGVNRQEVVGQSGIMRLCIPGVARLWVVLVVVRVVGIAVVAAVAGIQSWVDPQFMTRLSR